MTGSTNLVLNAEYCKDESQVSTPKHPLECVIATPTPSPSAPGSPREESTTERHHTAARRMFDYRIVAQDAVCTSGDAWTMKPSNITRGSERRSDYPAIIKSARRRASVAPGQCSMAHGRSSISTRRTDPTAVPKKYPQKDRYQEVRPAAEACRQTAGSDAPRLADFICLHLACRVRAVKGQNPGAIGTVTRLRSLALKFGYGGIRHRRTGADPAARKEVLAGEVGRLYFLAGYGTLVISLHSRYNTRV